jgi:ABC-2 type transport system ATP-binding protein
MPILSVEHLDKKFYRSSRLLSWLKGRPANLFHAVNDVSFSIDQGEIVGLLGPNGAGKTTIISMLLDILTPTSGNIFYFGKNIKDNRSTILERVSFASAYIKLPAQLTVTENLDVYARLYNIPYHMRTTRITAMLEQFGIGHLRNVMTGPLSAGQMTRLMLAKAFLHEPDIVLLDEPTASLDPDIAHDVRRFIVEQKKKRGIAILITSHNMNEVAQVCDRVLVLKNGSVIAHDTPTALIKQIDKATVRLLIDKDLESAIKYFDVAHIMYHIEGHMVHITIDEHAIAQLLIALVQTGVSYEHISIDRPTLEDYFLHIAKQ